ncbi:hypothetical protein MVEN_00464000 [Mycena venus]|uniref:Uncharacterized protein n=1 Tax=Mycena venus TaxID=2733690 RepID=A0A8H7D938_9AGAR|nr:hypothetical protein MVEN_00464000 [Mycena venus]
MFFFRALAAALLAETTLALSPAAHTASGQPVFVAPSGSRVKPSGRNMEVFAPNGTLIHTFENVIPTNLKTKRASSQPIRRQDLSVTEAYAQFGPTDVIQSFNTTFVVPPTPTTFESQIIFISANVQPLDANGVPFGNLRAALQYGGSWVQGGPFWTYAIQLEIPPSGFLQVTNSDNPNPGLDVGQRVISTLVHDTELIDPGIFWYIASFDNVPDAPVLEVGWQVPPQIAALELEEEGVFQASDYPAGSFVFEQVNLNLTTGPPTIAWNTSVDPTTNVEVTVDVDGSENAQISIVFPSS